MCFCDLGLSHLRRTPPRFAGGNILNVVVLFPADSTHFPGLFRPDCRRAYGRDRPLPFRPHPAIGTDHPVQHFFSTNLYFWLDMGYFQPNKHGNPLLNLWSLGVEEQFYIVIPFDLLLIWRFRQTILMPALILGFIGSLALWLDSKQGGLGGCLAAARMNVRDRPSPPRLTRSRVA